MEIKTHIVLDKCRVSVNDIKINDLLKRLKDKDILIQPEISEKEILYGVFSERKSFVPLGVDTFAPFKVLRIQSYFLRSKHRGSSLQIDLQNSRKHEGGRILDSYYAPDIHVSYSIDALRLDGVFSDEDFALVRKVNDTLVKFYEDSERGKV